MNKKRAWFVRLLLVCVIFSGCAQVQSPSGPAVSLSSPQESTAVAFPKELTVTVGSKSLTVEAGEQAAPITVEAPVSAEPSFPDYVGSMPWTAIASVYKDGELYWEDMMGALKFFLPTESGTYDYRITVQWEENMKEDLYIFTLQYDL